jgi:HEAT repeats/Tetratricopeptide repeat
MKKKIGLALFFCAAAMGQDAPQPPQPPQVLEKPWPVVAPAMPRAFMAQKATRAQRSGDGQYDRGASALDAGRWSDAVEIFSQVADSKGSRADGALYWKAYAQNKLGQRDAALATIGELRKDYASSRWLDDAKALEVEVHQQAGQPVSPNAESNDDLKMLALNGLLNSDPEQAVPLMEKVLQNNNTPKLKDRALFVLSQSRSPKAQELLTEAAKGKFNPDLQIRALRYIAQSGGSESRATLYSVYTSTNDLVVKKAILNDFITSKYTGANDPLGMIAKNEKNPELRREAIRRLGVMHSTETSDVLISLYGTETDNDIKKEIANSLFVQNNAKALVDLARKETNPAMKQELVQKLSIMHSKDATQYMMELLSK